MSLGLLRDAVLIKCETRGQQIGLIVGAALFGLACAAIAVWLFDLGLAGFSTLEDTPRRRGAFGSRSGMRETVWQTVFIGFGGALITGALALLAMAVAAINSWRLGTGSLARIED